MQDPFGATPSQIFAVFSQRDLRIVERAKPRSAVQQVIKVAASEFVQRHLLTGNLAL
jgi:hypothetical protein